MLTLVIFPVSAFAQESRAISTLTGPAGDLLRQWWHDGTAAGNQGDSYDNRDQGHSPFDLKLFPQFTPIIYTELQANNKMNWGVQTKLLPGVVLGNSSTSADILGQGSNPRLLYSDPHGLPFLASQYLHNNLYIYPAHHDYLAGRNGNPLINRDAYGDVFPTNTPYLIISQWSSYSDQPFLQATAATLAAFQPAVKTKLISQGMLVPTIQMILRLSYQGVKSEKDYLTGAAHPTVFDGQKIDIKKMVELAHSITLENIPPVAAIRVLDESTAAPGRDYFDCFTTEELSTSPFVVSRIYRSTAHSRQITLSAETSADLNKHPLTAHWVVLRGEPKKIKITPLNDSGTRVSIDIPYHEWANFEPGTSWGSNRVDIGLIVHNKFFYSAPAFYTSFSIDAEGRDYRPDGQIREMGYNMTDSFITVNNYLPLYDELAAEKLSPAAELLFAALQPAERKMLAQVGAQFRPAQAKLDAAQRYLKDATASKVEKDIQQANQTLTAATIAVGDLLVKTPPGMALPPKVFFEMTLNNLLDDPEFALQHADLIASLYLKAPADRQAFILAEHQRLAAFGIIQDLPGMEFKLMPLRSGSEPLAARVTAYEKASLRRYNAELLAHLLFPGSVAHTLRMRYTDFRISAAKDWRDVYHYTDQGILMGWTRYSAEKTMEFTADGHMMIARDVLGRCLRAAEVEYSRQMITGDQKRPRGAEERAIWTPLFQRVTDRVVTYDYDGPQDRVGHIHQPPATRP